MTTKQRPLAIGFACHSAVGGSGAVAVSLARELATRGHSIHFVGHTFPARLGTLAPNIHFHPVSVSRYSVFAYPEYTMPLAAKIADVMREYDLDIFHSHYAVPHCAAAILAKQSVPRIRTKLVCTLHGTDVYHLSKDPGYAPMIALSLNQHDAITAVSDHLRDAAVALLAPAVRVERIYNFVGPYTPNVARHDIRAELHLHDDEYLLVHASNLRSIKRIPDLLAVTARCAKAVKLKLLMLVGEPFEPFEPLAKELGLAGSIIVKQDPARLYDYMAAADLGLYTSDLESFGLAMLESTALGVPVVTYDASGTPEVIKHGETGLLFPIGAFDAMARGVVDLLTAAPRREQMSAAGRARARMLFAPDAIVAQYLELYGRLLGRGSAS